MILQNALRNACPGPGSLLLRPHQQAEAELGLFDTFIAQQDCVIDLETLVNHPHVERVTRMAGGWLCYEFHHELFGVPDFLVEGAWRERMERSPELRAARIEMLDEQRALLAPWHAKKRVRGGNGLLASPICTYYIVALRRMRWLDFVPVEGWGNAREVELVLESESKDVPVTAARLLHEWIAAGEAAGELESSGKPELSNGLVSARIICSRYSGHWLAGLWAHLSEARLKVDAKRLRIVGSRRGKP